MADPLNPRLYARLKKAFHVVTISKEGQAMSPDPREDDGIYYDQIRGQFRTAAVTKGEYYAVNCPYCGDTRKRLYFNHLYGKRDAAGRKMTYLAWCANENCLKDQDNSDELHELIYEGSGSLEYAQIEEGEVKEVPDEMPWPGPVTLLSELPASHQARAYLEERGFDPDVLARCYGVCYCHRSRFDFARERIIIPVWVGGKLKGWQSRHIGELEWHDREKRKSLPPKYWTCPGMPKSLLVYNLDVAEQYETGVLCEGPADTWRVGPMGMCIFGSDPSFDQKQQVVSAFRGHGLVLLLDPEEYGKVKVMEMVHELRRRMSGLFSAVQLPDGTDPGSLSREYLRRYVAREALRDGLHVSWKRRAV